MPLSQTALITIVLRFGPRLYFQNDSGFNEDDDESEQHDEDSADPSVNSAGREKLTMRTELTSLNAKRVELNDTSTKYGSTDAEVGLEIETMTSLEHKIDHQGSRAKIAHVTSNTGGPCKDNKLFSWLIKLIPFKVRQQPLNPYQEQINDGEIKRLITRKKTMKKSKSHVSFCT